VLGVYFKYHNARSSHSGSAVHIPSEADPGTLLRERSKPDGLFETPTPSNEIDYLWLLEPPF